MRISVSVYKILEKNSLQIKSSSLKNLEKIK